MIDVRPCFTGARPRAGNRFRSMHLYEEETEAGLVKDRRPAQSHGGVTAAGAGNGDCEVGDNHITGELGGFGT